MLVAMRPSLLRRSVATTIVILLASGPAALAQNPAVQVDPGSPAGTEYALPVDQARAIGGAAAKPGAGESASPGEHGATLFGEGVTPPRTSASRRDARQRAGSHRATGGDGAAAPTPDGAPGAPGSARVFAPVGESSHSALPWLVGSGALVLVLGAGLGRALRRVARPSES
jgi:hypothetical protein